MTTLTGRQIRQARELLGMNHSVLAQRTRCLTTLALRRTEESEDEATLSAKQDVAVRRTLDRLGVEVGPHGVRLRVKDT